MRILVTGGAGYIGSTAAAMLIDAGYEVNVLDDLSTGHSDSLSEEVNFINGTLLSDSNLDTALEGCQAVMHFAAKSLVGESVEKPELYEKVNVGGSKALFAKMKAHGISRIVLSSTAATYGEPKRVPITENDEPAPKNPYGATKLEIDRMVANSGFSAISLRYFNVAGAYKGKNGWLAERHNPETHLIPRILQNLNNFHIYGKDYSTPDGTCIRDYIHVDDVANAHIKAAGRLLTGKQCHTINLGTGKGYSVKEIVNLVEKITGQRVKYEFMPRRDGDPDILVADATIAKNILYFQPKHDIISMIETAYNWHLKNDEY